MSVSNIPVTSNPTIPNPDPQSVNPLESLVDKSKLPSQDPTTATNNPDKGKFYKKPIFKKIGILVLLLLGVVVLGSLVMTFLRRGALTIQKGGEIVWWGVKEEDSVVAPLIAEFQEKNPEVKVSYVRQSEKDYAQRLYNSLKKGTGPDIYEIHTSWIPDFREMFSVMPDAVMNTQSYKETFLPSISNYLTNKEGIIGIPLYYDALTLYINVDIFNLAHKEPPKTWNDLLFLSDPVKGGLTLKSGNELVQSAVALGNTSNVDYWQDILALIMFQNKINPANPDIKLMNEAISYYKDFQNSGVWNDRLPNSTTSFARGNVAMYFGTVSRAPEILRINPNIRFRTIPLPQLPNNSPTDPQYSYSNYYFQAVGKNSTNERLAWEFLRFMTEKESIAELNKQRKSIRAIEFPSPRQDMLVDFEKDAIIGSVLAFSDVAKSWYLADSASDGEGGINTNITQLYKNAVDEGKIDKKFADEIGSTLVKFGVSTK